MRVLRGDGGGMSDHILVEGKLRVDMKWVKTRRVGEIKKVVKVSELNTTEKYQERITDK